MAFNPDNSDVHSQAKMNDALKITTPNIYMHPKCITCKKHIMYPEIYGIKCYCDITVKIVRNCVPMQCCPVQIHKAFSSCIYNRNSTTFKQYHSTVNVKLGSVVKQQRFPLLHVSQKITTKKSTVKCPTTAVLENCVKYLQHNTL